MTVSARATGEDWTLTFMRDLKHPPEKVWEALTDPAQVSKWAPFITTDDLSVTGEATLVMIDGDTQEPSKAIVRVADKPSLLVYAWGDDLLRWELTPIPGGTRLSLHHTMGDRDWLSKTAAGWHLCVDVMEQVLAGESPEPIRGQDAMKHGWQELNDRYAEQLQDIG